MWTPEAVCQQSDWSLLVWFQARKVHNRPNFHTTADQTLEVQIDTHHLFVDFKAAFDSVNRDELYNTMSSFDIPAKLVRLCRMTLKNSRCSVSVGEDLTEAQVKNGLIEGDALSCDLFNIALERIV